MRSPGHSPVPSPSPCYPGHPLARETSTGASGSVRGMTKAAPNPVAAFVRTLDQAVTLAFSRISRASAAVSDGVLPTFTPAASSASFFA